MAQTRKQQADIERILKRVQDGLTDFESIWQKVYSAPTAALKEKHEADLKKEIKKLQRHRDQIKTWLSSPEIRDKEEMLTARKMIERDMERFKVCEKETKTKAFSKEALTNTPKKKLLDKPKLEVKSWIDRRISLLKGQLGERESQLDAEQRRGKKRNKAHEEVHVDHLQRLVERYRFHIDHLEMAWEMLFEDEIVVADIEEIQDDVDYFIENNQDEDMEVFDDAYMYELLAQKCNAKPPAPEVPPLVDVDSDLDLSDDLDYDSMLDDDYHDFEDDSEHAIDDEKSGGPAPDPVEVAEAIPTTPSRNRKQPAATLAARKFEAAPRSNSPGHAAAAAIEAESSKRARGPDKDSKFPQEKPSAWSTATASAAEVVAEADRKASAAAAAKPERETPKKKGKKQKDRPAQPIQVSSNYQDAIATPAVVVGRHTRSGSGSGSSLLTPSPSGSVFSPTKASPSSSGPSPMNSMEHVIPPPAPFANIVKQQQLAEQQAAAAAHELAVRQQTDALVAAEAYQRRLQQRKAFAAAQEAQEKHAAMTAAATVAIAAQRSASPSVSPDSIRLPPPGIRSTSPMTGQAPPGLVPLPPNKTVLANRQRDKAHQGAAASEEPAADVSLVRPSRLKTLQHAVPSSRDSSPFHMTVPPQAFDAPLSDEQKRDLEIMEDSLRHMPKLLDSDRPKQYLPRNPYHTPACWPSAPSPVLEEPAFFEKYDTDTLFFIFYFQQGTYQQYLAASQLKKQSWRYHTKYLTWFQRHEDPQVTTDEFEQGTYIYFDYDHSWCQRIKAEFTFEYRYLEDELQQ